MSQDVKGEATLKKRCYVIQTVTRQEEQLMELMRDIIKPSILTEAFTPKKEMNRRLGGEWRITEELLFPGYVFVYTPDPEALYFALRIFPRMSRLLHDDAYRFLPLTEKEQEFIEKIGVESGDHTFHLSKVCLPEKVPYKPGDRVRILGDLKNFEGEIVSYNLRKRKAIIKTKMFGGRDVEIHVGIEIVGDIQVKK